MNYQDMYYDLADVIARESGSHDELCGIARETRNERDRLHKQVAVIPDLLAACRAALIWLDSAPIHYENGVVHNGMDEGDVLGTRGHICITDQLTAAIAKAEGIT